MNFTDVLSILSIFISSLIGIWNIYIQKRYNRNEEKRKEDAKQKEIFDARPRFEIIHSFDTELNDSNNIFDLELLILNIQKNSNHEFYYSKNALNKKCWNSISFMFRNVGKSDISFLKISTNFIRSTALFNVTNDSYIHFINMHMLEVSSSFDRIIKPDDYFTIKINYLNSEIINNYKDISTFTLWMKDQYNNIWAQPLFTEDRKIYDSKQVTFNEYKKYTDTDEVIKNFF